MRKRNEKFAKDAREGKKPTHLSRQQRLEKSSPINLWALGLICFVVIGGGTPPSFCSHDILLNVLQWHLNLSGSSSYETIHVTL